MPVGHQQQHPQEAQVSWKGCTAWSGGSLTKSKEERDRTWLRALEGLQPGLTLVTETTERRDMHKERVREREHEHRQKSFITNVLRTTKLLTHQNSYAIQVGIRLGSLQQFDPLSTSGPQMLSCWLFCLAAKFGPSTREAAPAVAKADNNHSTSAKPTVLSAPGTFWASRFLPNWLCRAILLPEAQPVPLQLPGKRMQTPQGAHTGVESMARESERRAS